jgi:DNA-binding transcriptional MerR regulator
MRYLMADLVERSGLTSRTIRDYIKEGYLARPKGHGPAATYSEEQLLRVVAIARMRARGDNWEEIANRFEDWSLKQLRAYVRKTEPPASPPTAPASEPTPPPDPLELEGRSAPRTLPAHSETASTTDLDAVGDDGLAGFDEAARFAMVPLVPGLGIFLRADASPLAKRLAAEILRKYRAC